MIAIDFEGIRVVMTKRDLISSALTSADPVVRRVAIEHAVKVIGGVGAVVLELGVNQSTVSRWLSADVVPGYLHAERMAKLVHDDGGVSIYWGL